MNVLSLSTGNVWFDEFLDHIYPNELEIKGTTNTLKSTSYLYLEINYEDQFRSKLYDKRDNCNFSNCKLPIHVTAFQQYLHTYIYISINIIFQVSRTWSSYLEFLERGLLLT